MKLKKIVCLELSLFIVASGLNIASAMGPSDEAQDVSLEVLEQEDDIMTDDVVLSEAAVGADIATLAAAADTAYLAYAVEGGNIYYDPNTGEIKDCDESVTSAVIPSEIYGVKITSIDYRAFYKCSSLTSITIPDSVTSIGNYAFGNCSSLTSITIPDSVTSIGSGAFESCSSLISITIPDSVTSIGSGAFESCSSLISITIPDSVTSINSCAFKNCSNLISITIPNSIISIYGGAFYGCSALENLIIPDSVKILGWYSVYGGTFEGCNSLQSIKLPNGIKTIGLHAFKDCSSLENLKIPDSVTEIKGGAFYNCSSLKSIEFPNGEFTLELSAIIKTYEYGTSYAAEVDFGTFEGCKSLTSVEIPDGTSKIGVKAFKDCSSLSNINIPNSVTEIGGGAFYGCNNLTNVVIPASVINIDGYYYSYVTNQFCGLFESCINLKSVNFLNDITKIGKYSFSNCTNLESINLPINLNIIEYGLFNNCSKLSDVVIPEQVINIDNYAFKGCSSLKNIRIPDKITSLGDYVFDGCSNLINITLPQSATELGRGAFCNCYNLEQVNIINDNIKIDYGRVTEYVRNEENSKHPAQIGINDDFGGLFENCYKLKKVMIPNYVKKIGNGDFKNCMNLEEIEIPSGVTAIGYYAFAGCSNLKKLVVPSTVIYVSKGAFYGCDSIEHLSTGTSEIFGTSGFHNSSGSFLNYDSYKLGTLKKLQKVEFLEGVTTIPSQALEGCDNLINVQISNTVTKIGYSAFESCDSLKSIELPESVTFIGSNAFAWCNNLLEFNMPDSVTEIGGGVFTGCKMLKSIKLSSNIDTLKSSGFLVSYNNGFIYPGMFGFCRSLKEIEIPNKISTLDGNLFIDCESLEKINIPTSVTSIKNGVFSGCTSLKSIMIPDNVKDIGSKVFSDCKNLTIYCKQGSYAETYAKENNIPYSTEGYVEYTLTEDDLPADVGDSIRFEKKVYDFDGELYVGDIPYEFEVRALVKYESMLDNIEITCSDKSVLDVSKINYKGDYISMGDMLGYNYQARYQTTTFKNGEVILTATLPNGDSSSCLVRVKCYDMGYDVNNDFTNPNYFETRVTCENSITYDDNGFSKSSLPVTISYGNRRRIDHIYTDEEIANCTVQNLKIDVTLSAGLSFSSDNVNDKTRTFEIGNLGLNEGDTLQLEVYPTSYVSKQLSINVNFKADNIEVDNKGVIVVNSDKILDYNVSASTQEYVNTLSPEARVQFYLDEYYAQVAAYDKTTEGELNKIYKQSLASNSDDIYANIKDTLDSNLVITYDMLQSNEITEATRRALYQYITEGTDELIGIGEIDITENDVKIGASLVNDIRKSIISETVTESVSFKNASGKIVYYDVTFNLSGINGLNLSAFVCNNFKLVNKSTDVITTTATAAASNNEKVAAVMEAYVKQLQNIGIDVVNQGIASAIDFYSDTLGINKYLKSACLKKLESALPLLKNRNLGEIYTFAQCISKDFDILKNIDPNDLDNCMSSIKSILNTDFTGNTISNQVINQSFTQVKKARNNLIEAFTYYMGYGTMPENFVQKVLKNFFTQCPVDVYVYDSSGNELGSVVDGVIKCDSDIISISTVGESKIVSLLQNEEIKFKIVATDFGSLNVTVEDYSDEGAVIGRTNYYDIPLKIEDEFTTELIAADTENIIIYSSNTEYQYNEKLSSDNDGGVNIDTENLNGKVFGTGRYVKGDYVTLSAVPDEGYLFAGWYNGDEFISGNVTYNLTAKEDLTLVAKFSGIVDNTVVVGDVNGDGNVTTADALVVARLAIGKIQNEELSSVCDFNNDGKITTVDALILARYAIGKISEL
ncbi:MAG: leucine-rich repeat protein [Clostridia bacterium]|nr:leucine-rich repeat protein [Clostridia bacterium]